MPLFNFNPETDEIADSTLVTLEGLSTIQSGQLLLAIREINGNREGNSLLDEINHLYDEMISRGVASHLTFKPLSGDTGKTSFSARRESGEVRLTVELAGTYDSEYPVLHSTRGPAIAAIHSAVTPFWITLAHELIHLKHYLEQECQYEKLKGEKTEELMEKLSGVPPPSQKDRHTIGNEISAIRNDMRQRQLLSELFLSACSGPPPVIKNIPYSIAKEQISIEDVLTNSSLTQHKVDPLSRPPSQKIKM